MTQTRKAGPRLRVATVGGLAALAVAAVVSLAAAAEQPAAAATPIRASQACPLSGVLVADSTAKDIRRSIRCRINEERAIHGFSKLRRSRPLQSAAQRHTKTMVATGCLAHRCGGERDLESRLRAAGYFDGADSWRYAENTGCGASAEAMIANWMQSLYHRVNILDAEFTEVGVGVSTKRVAGPCNKGFGTFTVVFGDRTP